MDKEQHIKPVVVFAGNSIEVSLVKNLLENAGIQAYLQDEIQGMIAPWVISPGGAGAIKILVSSADYVKAKEIVDDYQQNTP